MESDSDDDLFPSVDKFNDMFKSVERQVRDDESRSSQSQTGSMKSKTEKVPKKVRTKQVSTSAANKEPDSTPKSQEEEDEISPATKALLEETDALHLAKSIPKSKSRDAMSSFEKTTNKRRKIDKEADDLYSEDFGVIGDSGGPSSAQQAEMYSVRVRWKNEIARFKVPKNSKMSKVRMDIASTFSVRPDNVIILHETEEIPDGKSVLEIPLEMILEAFERERTNTAENVKVKNLAANEIIIRLQGSRGYRERCSVVMKKTTHLQQLVDDYKENFGLQEKEFKLVFDGDSVNLSDTPESLDLENNDMFDVVEI